MFGSYTNTVIMYVHVGLFSRWKEFCWRDGKAKKARSYVIQICIDLYSVQQSVCFIFSYYILYTFTHLYMIVCSCIVKCALICLRIQIRHVDNIPTMQFFTGISRNILSKSYKMLSLTECVWDFLNNALWDTH